MDMTEVKKFDLQVGTLKLSEAILAGCLKRQHQCFGAAYGITSSCAIGAAADGLDIEGDYMDSFSLAEAVADRTNTPPHLAFEVIKRNDTLRESRESIADWLESQGY